MSDDVDPDRLELARALSTQVGMRLEDVSAQAVLLGGLSAAQLARTVGEVRKANAEVEALLAAAAVLLEKSLLYLAGFASHALTAGVSGTNAGGT